MYNAIAEVSVLVKDVAAPLLAAVEVEARLEADVDMDVESEAEVELKTEIEVEVEPKSVVPSAEVVIAELVPEGRKPRLKYAYRLSLGFPQFSGG